MEGFLAWLLESSLLVLMILGIRKLFSGKIPYAGIYALWLLVLLRFMIPVNFISTPISVSRLCSEMYSTWDTVRTEGREAESGAVIRGTGSDGAEEFAETDGYIGNALKEQGKIHQKKTGKRGVLRRADINREQSAVKTGYGQSYSEGMWLALRRSWLIVSVVLFLWIFLSNACLLSQIKRDRVLYGHRGGVKIYTVCGIKTPCLYGFLHPSIYLPASFFSIDGKGRVSKEDLEQMITHEFVHYIHRDYIWALFRMLLVSVYWFHPFVWLASSCSKKDAELFCDETVVRFLGEERRFSYGEMLVRLAGEPGWGDFRFSILPMSRKGREMEKRICAISIKKRYSKWFVIPLAVVLVVAVSLTCNAGLGTIASEGKQTKNSVEDIVTDGNEESIVSGSAVNVAKTSTGPAAEEVLSQTMSGKTSQGEAEAAKKSIAAVGVDVSQSEEGSVYADTCRAVFDNYMEIFTDAVNTGRIHKMSQVLDVNSDVYEQQCNLVKNYYKRGIHEKVKFYEITSITEVHPVGTVDSGYGSMRLDSREKIKVFYADDSSKVVKQKYRYTCEYIGQTWFITKMEEIS